MWISVHRPINCKMFGKGAPRCPRCGDNVYGAEGVKAAGRDWHSSCYSCKNCKKQLGPTTQADKDGELYCQNCYARLFGPKGFNIGGATTVTGVSVADSAGGNSSSSAGGSFCPSCGAAGQGGKFCSSCGATRGGASTASTSTVSSSASSSASSSSYKPTPAASSFKPAAPASSSSNSALFGSGGTTKIGGGQSDKCGRCGKTVYHAEKVTGAGQIWHEQCFTCETCGSRLSSATLQDKDGRIFCKTDYSKQFGPKGYGFSGGGATTMAFTK